MQGQNSPPLFPRQRDERGKTNYIFDAGEFATKNSDAENMPIVRCRTTKTKYHCQVESRIGEKNGQKRVIESGESRSDSEPVEEVLSQRGKISHSVG